MSSDKSHISANRMLNKYNINVRRMIIMSFGEIIKRAGKLIKLNGLKMFLYMVLVGLISLCISTSGSLLMSNIPQAGILLFPVTIYISTVLTLGLYKIFIKSDEEEEYSVSDLFSFLKKPKECFRVWLFQMIYGVSVFLIFFILFFILCGSSFISLYNIGTYSYYNNAYLNSVMMSTISKMILTIIITMLFSAAFGIFPTTACALAGKDNDFLNENFTANVFSWGFKNMKYYIGLCLIFFLMITGIGKSLFAVLMFWGY